MNRFAPVVAALAIGAAAPAMAQQSGHAEHHPATVESLDDTFVEGVVKKVDREAGKVTLKHGPIPNLEMPAMTMVFHVKDPAALDTIKVGDTLRFKAEKIEGALTITELKPAS